LTGYKTRTAPIIGMVSTYPPTTCGLATFTSSLRSALSDLLGSSTDGLPVVSVVDAPGGPSGVASSLDGVYEHTNGDPASLVTAVDRLNQCDVVLIQHEYGIFGGPDGVEVLSLIDRLDVPSVATLHTVPNNPTSAQKSILEAIVETSDRTVLMSNAASLRLVSGYDVDPSRIRVIPHGVNPALAGAPRGVRNDRPVVLSWGLIGPGKGLETAIAAFAWLGEVPTRPRYVILGDTHPKVKAQQGDRYLKGLEAQAERAGVSDIVEFDTRYLDRDSLVEMVRSVDMVLIPYDSREQVTSGVLVEAIAAGKPVVATAFPHAVELLGTGAGIVVPHEDPVAMAAAMGRLLNDPALARRMGETARALGSSMYWPAVAASYETLVNEVTSSVPISASLPDIVRIA
jgi:polysaccharide biosynthesis protein PslF